MYNDNQLANQESITAMRQKFDEVRGLETRDLEEIYHRLIEQKEQLLSANSDSSLDNAIHKIDGSISAIGEIINKSNSVNQSHSVTSNKKPSFRQFSLQSMLNRGRVFNVPEDGAYGKIRSEEEMTAHSTPSNLPSTQMPNEDNSQLIPPQISNPPQQGINNPSDAVTDNNGNLPPQSSTPPQSGINNPSDAVTDNEQVTPPMSSSQNTRKRNSPMQGSIISNLAKSLFLRKQRRDVYNIPLIHRNRFHNIIAQGETCHPRRRLANNQIDLIRLLLLFIALRPNCKYLSKVARVASTQLEVLMDIMP